MSNNQPEPQPDPLELDPLELDPLELETAAPTPTPENPPRSEQEAPPTIPHRKGMKLILEGHKKKLKANWPRSGKEPPVLKIFNPVGASTWLIHSMDPGDEDTLFGLCDHGFGSPERGYVSLSALQEVHPKVRVIINGRPLEMPVHLERDRHFQPTHSLSVYANAARAESGITERLEHRERAAGK